MIIKINIANKRPAVESDPITGKPPVIVCGNTDYQIQFTFDKEWDSFTAKTALFVWRQDGQLQTCEAPFNGDTVSVPMLQEAFYVHVGVFAGELHTTTSAKIECEYSVKCDAKGAKVVYPPEVTQAVLCIAQDLSDEQQAQARENIGAAAVGEAGLSVEQVQAMIDTSIAKIAVYEGETEDVLPIINFTWENIPFQAVEGMTWEQFINSEYNTDNTFALYPDGRVQMAKYGVGVTAPAENGMYTITVYGVDEIIAGLDYHMG